MTTLQLNNNLTAEKINSMKLQPQAKQLLLYILKTREYTAFDQRDFLLELNKHQNDTVVFDKIPVGPISRTFEFYRKKHFIDAGLLLREKSQSAKTKVAEYIEYLQSLLEENDIEFKTLDE